MDIYKLLYKLTTKAAEEVIEQSDEFSLPVGFVTDGYGNIYKIPTKGKTPLYYPEDSKEGFQYNWETKQLEIEISDDFIESIDIEPTDFIDNPDYWFREAQKNFDDEIKAEISEDYNDDTIENKYGIKFNVEVTDISADQFEGSWEAYYDAVDEMLVNYNIKYEIYGQDISLKVNSTADEILVKSVAILDKNDLLEIWDDYADFMIKTAKSLNYEIKLTIEDIIEY